MGWDDDVDLDDIWSEPEDAPDPAEILAHQSIEPAPASTLDIIRCRVGGCHSDDLRVKSTEPITGKTKFVCNRCGATTTVTLPRGYRTIRIRVTQQPAPPEN